MPGLVEAKRRGASRVLSASPGRQLDGRKGTLSVSCRLASSWSVARGRSGVNRLFENCLAASVSARAGSDAATFLAERTISVAFQPASDQEPSLPRQALPSISFS